MYIGGVKDLGVSVQGIHVHRYVVLEHTKWLHFNDVDQSHHSARGCNVLQKRAKEGVYGVSTNSYVFSVRCSQGGCKVLQSMQRRVQSVAKCAKDGAK